MEISNSELESDGFRRAGTVSADPTKILRVQIDWDVQGFVVYLMVVNGEIKKAGTTGSGRSSFKSRMISECQTVRQVIAGAPAGRPPAKWRLRPLDPFKQHAPNAILANHQVELWAREFPTFRAMFDKETLLNNAHQPQWTKEGRLAKKAASMD
jgi:hypothetical protein